MLKHSHFEVWQFSGQDKTEKHLGQGQCKGLWVQFVVSNFIPISNTQKKTNKELTLCLKPVIAIFVYPLCLMPVCSYICYPYVHFNMSNQLGFKPHQTAHQRTFHINWDSKSLHIKDPLSALEPHSSDVPHTGTLLYFDSHIVTQSYGSNQACLVYA